MRELYGAGAAMIHGMETAMQLSFDRNTDRHKPRPWPALPLNIQFDWIVLTACWVYPTGGCDSPFA